MIRYVRIGDQITEGCDEFAFFNTCDGRFITLGGEQVFSSVKDFIAFGKKEPVYDRCLMLILGDRSKEAPK